MSKKRQQPVVQHELQELREQFYLLSKQVAKVAAAKPKAKLALVLLQEQVDWHCTLLNDIIVEKRRIEWPKLQRLLQQHNQLSKQVYDIATVGEHDTGKAWREWLQVMAATGSAAATLTTTVFTLGAIPADAKAEDPPKPGTVIEQPLKRQEHHYVRQETTNRLQELAKLRNEAVITQDDFRATEQWLLVRDAVGYDSANRESPFRHREHYPNLAAAVEGEADKAEPVEAVEAVEAVEPTQKTVEVEQTRSSEGFSMTLKKLEFGVRYTRAYVTARNDGNKHVSLDLFISKISQGSEQTWQTNPFGYNLPKPKRGLQPGEETEGVVIFRRADPSQPLQVSFSWRERGGLLADSPEPLVFQVTP